MMTRPTKEQLEQARAQAERMATALQAGLLTSLAPGVELDALRVLLAATAEPAEEELAEEACAAVLADCGLEGEEAAEVRVHIMGALHEPSDNVDHAAEARAYIRGARREGAR